MMNNTNNFGQFGDTTLTKVFVGGLAWETPKEALREYFDKFGEILEAVIICDKLTGRSKGYGFVTFKEAEAAKKACEEATMVINGRRANCNLASVGARRTTRSYSTISSSSPTQPQGGSNSGPPRNCNQVQCYYPVGTPASPFHHHAVPYYGYTPTYVPTNMNYNYNYSYNQKLSYSNGGDYMNGQLSHVMYPSQANVGASTWMPMYPLYDYHRSETFGGVTTQIYRPIIPSRSLHCPQPLLPTQLAQVNALKGWYENWEELSWQITTAGDGRW